MIIDCVSFFALTLKGLYPKLFFHSHYAFIMVKGTVRYPVLSPAPSPIKLCPWRTLRFRGCRCLKRERGHPKHYTFLLRDCWLPSACMYNPMFWNWSRISLSKMISLSSNYINPFTNYFTLYPTSHPKWTLQQAKEAMLFLTFHFTFIQNQWTSEPFCCT